jgi:hypothetical protein
MEKLEKHIKEKLEGRKLSPSSKAWESIESSLGSEAKTSSSNKYWYAIAASVIGLLIISVVYISSQNKNEQPIEVVEVEKEPVIKEIDILNKTEVVDVKDEVAKQLEQEIEISTKSINPSKENFIQKSSDIADIEEVTKEQNSINDGFVKANTQDLLIDKKINEVLATVINLESEAIQVSDAEVDSLLRVAQFDILKEKVFQNNGKVDAMALLTEVEDELDQSFRDKIFTKLKEGLFKARTAVADRNN